LKETIELLLGIYVKENIMSDDEQLQG